MKKFFLISFLFSLLTTQAQTGKVSGTLLDDETNSGIPYSNVILYNINDSVISGTFTNESGKFEITNIKYGSYYASYQPLTHTNKNSEKFSISAKNKSIKLGNIPLSKEGITTEEVEIKVEKAAVKIEPAKKTFDVKATGADAGGTATEVLNNLPSVDVDENGNVSLRGNSNLRVLIDGKPAGVDQEDISLVLSQLPANSIESVEVITVPSAKYDPEGVGGIINIVLKKQRKQGVNGNVNASYAMNDKVNLSASLNYQKSKWGISGSYSLNDGTYWGEGKSDAYTTVDDSTTFFLTQNRRDRKNQAHIGKLAATYDASKATTISLEGRINYIDKFQESNYTYDWNYNDESTTQTKRTSSKTGERTSGVGQLGIQSKVKKVKINAFTRIQNGFNYSDGNYIETLNKQKEDKNFNSEQWVNQIDLEYPLTLVKDTNVNPLKVESGIKTAVRTFEEDFDFFDYSPSAQEYQLNSEFSNNLNYGENVYAGYTILNWDLKKVQISAGLRAEYTNINSTVSDSTFKTTIFNWFPSASVVKNFSEMRSLTWSYSKRIKRPTGRMLNPIPSFVNPFAVHVGNASLIPERSHLAEISFLNITPKVTFNGTLFYQYRDDRMGRLSFTDSLGYTTIQWINFNYHQTGGLELFFNFKLAKWINVNTSGTFYRTWVDGENFRDGYIANYNGFDLKANMRFMPSKNTSITLTGDYNSRRVAVVGVVLPRYGADISLKHKFWESKAFFTLRYTDIFFTRGFWIDVNADNWYRGVSHRYESQMLWVGLGYNFGKTPGEKHGKKPHIQKNRGGDAM